MTPSLPRPVQIDDVIDEIISLESSYDELLSFGPAEGPLPLPSTVRGPFKTPGGRGPTQATPFDSLGRGSWKAPPTAHVHCHGVGAALPK